MGTQTMRIAMFDNTTSQIQTMDAITEMRVVL